MADTSVSTVIVSRREIDAGLRHFAFTWCFGKCQPGRSSRIPGLGRWSRGTLGLLLTLTGVACYQNSLVGYDTGVKLDDPGHHLPRPRSLRQQDNVTMLECV